MLIFPAAELDAAYLDVYPLTDALTGDPALAAYNEYGLYRFICKANFFSIPISPITNLLYLTPADASLSKSYSVLSVSSDIADNSPLKEK